MESFLLLPVGGRRNFGYATHVLAVGAVAAADMDMMLGWIASHADRSELQSRFNSLCAHDAWPHPAGALLIGANPLSPCS